MIRSLASLVSPALFQAAAQLRGVILPVGERRIGEGVVLAQVSVTAGDRWQQLTDGLYSGQPVTHGSKLVACTDAALLTGFQKIERSPFLDPNQKALLKHDFFFIRKHGTELEKRYLNQMLDYVSYPSLAERIFFFIRLVTAYWDHLPDRPGFLNNVLSDLPAEHGPLEGALLEMIVFDLFYHHPDTVTVHKWGNDQVREVDVLAQVGKQIFILEAKRSRSEITNNRDQRRALKRLAQEMGGHLIYVHAGKGSLAHKYVGLPRLRAGANDMRGDAWTRLLKSYAVPLAEPSGKGVSRSAARTGVRERERYRRIRQAQMAFKRRVSQKTRDAVALIDTQIYFLARERQLAVWEFLLDRAEKVDCCVKKDEAGFLERLREALQTEIESLIFP